MDELYVIARRRRFFSIMSRPTLRAVEKGEPEVMLGSYSNVLHSLGLHENLRVLARDDELGRKL